MSDHGIPALLGLVRAAHVAGVFSVFGSLAFLAIVLPGPSEAWHARRFGWWILASLAAAIVFEAVWILLVAREVTGKGDLALAASAVPTLLARTAFGWNSLFRLTLLVGAAACLALPTSGSRRWTFVGGAVVAAFAVLLLTGVSHAAALRPAQALLPRAIQALHLEAAGLWLGGLVPLLLALNLPLPIPQAAARRFSRLGVLCVATLVATAIGNAWIWVGSVAGLFNTPYGRWVLVKLVLFAAMLVLAALNRWRFTPALAGAAPDRSRDLLRRSITIEALLGLALVGAAGILASTPPAVQGQPSAAIAYQHGCSK